MSYARTRFWTATELDNAVNVLVELASEDAEGMYFGGESVGWLLYTAYRSRPTPISLASAQLAARMLTVLGFLAHRPQGVAKSGYKRRFHPKARVITAEAADMAWNAVTA